ncbi:hypothetical protein [Micromonospora endophytica]|uniref:Uncharacterized protein n=1 Tax=Micromonospora endophytica TaxID=515350 RepID=A0A2W2DBU4_9ACTN|nr:hypothetical protein [Micromonospora endophytica]PZF90073.1 hypothetical protein C1I93_23195 [Micromonospora endophytica]RIW41595.1 hypothetical protein D3H59_25650 [Micromonospora endophytica]BCJ61225.1 hypothetical protein Jiend_46470 [Micromonospora endophytica]
MTADELHRQVPTLPGHDGALDGLRDAWSATIVAADRAGSLLHGAGPLGRRLPWQDAVTECWRALGLLHAGLGEARAVSGAAGDLIAGLRTARNDADRAAAGAARTRWWLAAAEDGIRRAHRPQVSHPASGVDGRARPVVPLTATRRFGLAVHRLDLVAVRLAVGQRAIDRWVAALHGHSEPAPTLPIATDTTVDNIARGAAIALRSARARANTTRRMPRRRAC